jgi:phenylalanyl-tRNA synthetase alpha chain
MDTKKLALSLHPLERKVLPHLKSTSTFEELVSLSQLQPVEVMRALQWLSNKKAIILHEDLREQIKLEENGKLYQEKGLPEYRFLRAIKGDSTVDEIKEAASLSTEEATVCLGFLRKKGYISMRKDDTVLIISLTEEGKTAAKQTHIEESLLKKEFPIQAYSLTSSEKEAIIQLRTRKNILVSDLQKIVTAKLTDIGKKLSNEDITDDIADRLTSDILKSDKWQSTSFRRYDVKINVPPVYGGRRHYVEQAIEYIKRIWLDLGFKEMEGKMVQTAFWDLDALFVPQDHPAREMQDTFYIKDPATGKLPRLHSKVKDMHEHGGTLGSKGWNSKWSSEIAIQNMLRTHTTVLSAQTIAKLHEEDLPAKYFTVGRVYRNEALSWKHLFEFTQVEGIVVDPDANFKHLKGYLSNFFKKMGFEKIRIRPGHFPYTEPSAEVDVWHPTKKQWVELGGSGIFRPEVVEPLLGKDVPVLAWGLGLERSIMEYYGFQDVRLLYQNDLKNLRESKLWLR